MSKKCNRRNRKIKSTFAPKKAPAYRDPYDVITDYEEAIGQSGVLPLNEHLELVRQHFGEPEAFEVSTISFFPPMQKLRCFQNAEVYADSLGGEVVYGWQISYRPQMHDINGMWHAVVRTPDGRLIDPTPCDCEGWLFVPSNEAPGLIDRFGSVDFGRQVHRPRIVVLDAAAVVNDILAFAAGKCRTSAEGIAKVIHDTSIVLTAETRAA